MAREKFQTVIHLAAQTLVPYSMEHPEEDEDLNVTAMVHLLEGCRKTGWNSSSSLPAQPFTGTTRTCP